VCLLEIILLPQAAISFTLIQRRRTSKKYESQEFSDKHRKFSSELQQIPIAANLRQRTLWVLQILILSLNLVLLDKKLFPQKR